MLEAKTVQGNGIGSLPSGIRKAEDKPPVSLSKILINGSTVAITPDLAHRILLECSYERQRRVRPLHSQALAMQIKNKEWTPGTQIHFARMASDGWLQLVNGYHRLDAVKDANRTVEFQVLVTECKTQADVARLYRRHDRLIAPRTISDALRAEGIPEKYGIGADLAARVFRAVLIINTGFSFTGRIAKADPYLYRSDEARLRLCEAWWPIAEQFADAVQNAPLRPIKSAISNQGPLAVALVTLRDQELKADAFWRGLANNDGLKRDDPRSAYLRFLNLNRQSSPFITAKAASTAWNAFFGSKKIAFIRPTESPIRLAGCELE